MATVADQIAIIHFTQPATAKSKNYIFNLGWKPMLVEGFCEGPGNAEGVYLLATEEGAEGGYFRNRNGVVNALGTDGITFTDTGFKIGQDANLKVNNGKFTFRAYRMMETETWKVAAADAKTGVPKAYGDGKQFSYEENADGSVKSTGQTLAERVLIEE